VEDELQNFYIRLCFLIAKVLRLKVKDEKIKVKIKDQSIECKI
jgi:ribosomal protein L25 (general stress protein Ctc)